MDTDILYRGDNLNMRCILVTTGSVADSFGSRANRP